LVDVFRLAAEHYPSGIIPLGDREIERQIGWTGEHGALVTALIEGGQLERYRGGSGGYRYRVHAWIEHNAYAAAGPERSQKARLAARFRHASSKPRAMRQAQEAHAPSNAPVPDPDPTPDPVPDPQLHPPTPQGGSTSPAIAGNRNGEQQPRARRRQQADFEPVGETAAQRVARRGEPASTILAKLAGQQAGIRGEPQEANHFPEGSREREFWDLGWQQAQPAVVES
jgi:hypothetical protein